MKLSVKRAKEIIENYSGTHILVLGDLMLDKFMWGEVRRISPEAPVPVVEVERESTMPGGSANVVNNICAMGGKCSVSGVIGDDALGSKLIGELQDEGAFIKGIIRDVRRKTTMKTRIIARHQQVVRFDSESKISLSHDIYAKVIEYVTSVIDDVDAVIIEDYGKGFFSQEMVRSIVELCRTHNRVATYDPKMGHKLNVAGITSGTPNREEALYFAGLQDDNAAEKKMDLAGKILLEKWKAQYILMTLGDRGMCLFSQGDEPFEIPTAAREVFDVSGAGDTVIGAFTLSLASGATPYEAALLANYAAGVVVGKLGTDVAKATEILEVLQGND